MTRIGTSVILGLSLLLASSPAVADVGEENSHPGQGPLIEQHGFDPAPDLVERQSLITDEMELPVAGLTAAGCQRAPASSRLTIPPVLPTGKRIAFVYVLPSASDPSWSDSYLDLPMLCPDGSAWSHADYLYRNLARFTARETDIDSGLGARRYNAFVNTYTWLCSTGTCSRSLYSMYLLRTTNTRAYWDALAPSAKLSTIRTKLIAAGFDDNPNISYMTILHAQQDDHPSTTKDDRVTLGTAWLGGYDTGYGYGYVLRSSWGWVWDEQQQQYVMGYRPTRFGCAEVGDVAVLHEMTHIAGAVPSTTGNGAGHMTGDGDLMSVSPVRIFDPQYNSDGTVKEGRLVLDRSTDDYRGVAFSDSGYAGGGTSFLGQAYRTCQ